MEEALRHNPNNADLLCDYAGFLIVLNDYGKVEEVCRWALSLDSKCINAYLNLAKLGVEFLTAEDLTKLRVLLQDPVVSEEHRARIHFVFSLNYRQQKSYSLEFNHLKWGNRLKKESQNYCIDDEVDTM